MNNEPQGSTSSAPSLWSPCAATWDELFAGGLTWQTVVILWWMRSFSERTKFVKTYQIKSYVEFINTLMGCTWWQYLQHQKKWLGIGIGGGNASACSQRAKVMRELMGTWHCLQWICLNKQSALVAAFRCNSIADGSDLEQGNFTCFVRNVTLTQSKRFFMKS